MFVRGFIQRIVHNVSKTLFTNCELLSMMRKERIRYRTNNLSQKMDTTCSPVVFDDGIDRVSFLYRSAMTMVNWSLVVVFGRFGSHPKYQLRRAPSNRWRRIVSSSAFS